ncbi:MAG: PEFG-CTERM sorting domain-containing protein [Nitrosopumilus sp.]|nr:PEFG-CTERM sorting domain-containing protein [Nitrosopumilus sp.]MDF2423221.1 PEFG-CTERM sorting domain-containing protein [Nitrosopumilus sp.]MDF2423713.1 PEFG-CTERM sorting domain-containing protein [Nitrosopumilus sp.]MDF2424937.1 PEFG-CTERM sorting domain-containing protein [Nitrosopumilus sp.]MDF2427939.1 PEFG-CTERM sorting domain-containing protein [Nitrosopumilus sp.]
MDTVHISTGFRPVVFKITLLALIVISVFSASAFAEVSIEVEVQNESVGALDSVLVSGKITGVGDYKPVKITVTDPDGVVVYGPLVTIQNDKTFKKLIQPTLPSFKAGTYTVTASHEDTEMVAQAYFTVTSEIIPRNQVTQTQPHAEPAVAVPKNPGTDKISLTADTINGSNIIKINGNTDIRSMDVTFTVKAPSGNIISVGQVSPDVQGKFQLEVKAGFPVWKENGVYTITAYQGASSEYKKSIHVEIEDGVVVPEFGAIASLVLIVSVFAIIMVSSKSKFSIVPRF